MASDSENDPGATTSNLKHVYFFIDQATDAHTDENSAASTSNGSTQNRSRTSSPGSNDTGSASFTTASTSNSEMNPRAEEFKPGSKTLAVPPEPSATHLYELRQTADKGLGLFATSFIRRGTEIIREEPLLKISENAIQNVWGPYCRLTTAQKAAYDSLHAFKPHGLNLEHASRCYLIDPNDDSLEEDDIEEMVQDQVRVMSIFAVNNFRLAPSGLAVYATASRLNHSCVPNVHHSYNPTLKRITVHAVRDILPNEELFTTYLGGDGAYQVRGQRIEKLRSAYGFICHCPACSDHTGTSDGRRELMSRITWGLTQFTQGNIIPHPFVPAHPLAGLKQAEDLITVMLTEDIVTIELTKAYRVASAQALKLKDFDRALEYARDEALVERNCLGTALNDLRRLGVASECWIERIYEVVRVEQGEDKVKAYRDAAKRERKKAQKMRYANKRKEEAKNRVNGGSVGAGKGVEDW